MEKEYDKNFNEECIIIERSLLNTLIENALISINDNVIELNPGKGVLSETLAKRSKTLTCIDISRENEHYLNVLKDKYNNVKLLYGSFLNINTPFCDRIITSSLCNLSIDFITKIYNTCSKLNIIQIPSNIGNMILSKQNDKLSIYINSLYEVSKITDVAPYSYDPAAPCDVMVISLKLIDEEIIKFSFKKFIIRELFTHKEKKVKNILSESLIKFASVHDKKLTKKESKSIIDEYALSKEILNKLIFQLNDEDIQMIYNSLK